MSAAVRSAHELLCRGLNGKRAFVSAAGQGIGRATALALSAAGAEVVAADIASTSLAKLTADDPAIEPLVLDVTDAAAVARTFGGRTFHVLCNFAGVVVQGSLLDCDESDWQRSFDLNVTSMYRVCRSALPHMIAAGGGSIINMSSVASSVKGVPARCAYSASKAAVIGLTRSIAADYVANGIRCNAICPGTVLTPSLEQRVRMLGGDETAAWAAFTGRQPMGRLGTADEIAALAVYLASDAAAFTTGAIHVIDGGWSM